MKEILINVEPKERRVAVLVDKVLDEFFVERTNHKHFVGNVYKGKVSAVVPGIQAAFVDIGMEKNGFLYVSDIGGGGLDEDELAHVESEGVALTHKKKGRRLPSITESVKVGDEIVVQVVKEPLGTKGARLTTHVSLPGRYLVLMPGEPHVGVSKRIHDHAERDRLKKLLAELELPPGMGFIVRTAGVGKGKKEFASDVRYLVNSWKRLQERHKRVHAPAPMHEEYDLTLRVVRDNFTDDVDKLIIDSPAEFRKVFRFARSLMPHLSNRVELYRGKQSLYEKWGIEKELDGIYNRRVPLKCGGYLIIEQTESLVAIDVNSGRFTGKHNLEETVFKVNLEAAQEVARQLRLRDIGGIIIIDFIDMEVADHRRRLFRAMEDALRQDRAKTNILTLSDIGLIEMTRQRVRKSLESEAYQTCPYCRGRGSVKSVATMAIECLRQIKKFVQETGQREVQVNVSQFVASQLLNDDRTGLTELENQTRCRIVIQGVNDYHLEEVRIFPWQAPAG
ncbi:MAG: Rne/Rng family ribonuclease [Candidatus Omnitrophica bacterium]|nr:Rne/Rng family ribonuclease [Candidatus Omnitrophota bacterium]